MAINKNKVMEAAQKLVEKGQTDRAIKEYLKVVQEDPKDVRCWLKIGDLYAKKGAKAEATETYLKVAQFYGEQGFYLKAVAVYKQVLKLDPRVVEVNLKLAELYRHLGLMSDAVQQFELVAAFYHREGKTKEALATIQMLCELDPDNVATRIKLAELYSKEQVVDKAVEEFARAAQYLKQHNRIDDYMKVAERIVWHKPDDLATTRELAQLYLQRSDPRQALRKLQVCFKADPRDVDTLALLAQAFQGLGQSDKTVSVLKELARILQDNGDQARALDVWRQILKLVPADADAAAAVGGRRPAPTVVPTPATVPPPMTAPPPSASPPLTPPPYAAAPVVTAPPVAVGAPRVATPISVPAVRGPSGSHTSPIPQAGGLPMGRAPASQPRTASVSAAVTHRPPSELDVELDLEEIGAAAEEASVEAPSALAEQHADEIARILTETDVYVKYGLHQKAVEHLQRVFDLDPRSVEAHEKLKDVYRTLHDDEAAIEELVKLVELTARVSPEQATGYLEELQAIDPGEPRIGTLAAQFRLTVPPMRERRGDEARTGRVGLDSFDDPVADAWEIGDAGGSPSAVSARPANLAIDARRGDRGTVRGGVSDFGEDAVSIQFDELPIDRSARREASEAAVEAVANPDLGMEFEFDDLASGVKDVPSLLEDAEPEMELAGLEPPPGQEPADSLVDDLDFDAGFGDPDLDGAVPQAGVVPAEGSQGVRSAQADGYGADSFEPQTAETNPAELNDAFQYGDALPGDGQVDDAADGFLGGPAPSNGAVAGIEPHPSGAGTDVAIDAGLDAAGTNLEDDLDQADFLISQGLFDDARDIIDELTRRYPNNPLVDAKAQELATAASGGAEPAGIEPVVAPAASAQAGAVAASAPASPSRPIKRIVTAEPLGEEDAATHWDLGLAYKEMGLLDEATREFSLLLETPGRVVVAYQMIGQCCAAAGKWTDAISQFKKGLNTDGIAEREALDLYFELGVAYQMLNDAKEALYYFEKVAKRDPQYREVQQRVAEVRQASARQGGGAA